MTSLPSELRFVYRVHGLRVLPRVTVRREDGRWHASVLVTDQGSTLHMTRSFELFDDAVAAAESFIEQRYATAALTREAA